jgi:hypothetical protein
MQKILDKNVKTLASNWTQELTGQQAVRRTDFQAVLWIPD